MRCSACHIKQPLSLGHPELSVLSPSTEVSSNEEMELELVEHCGMPRGWLDDAEDFAVISGSIPYSRVEYDGLNSREKGDLHSRARETACKGSD